MVSLTFISVCMLIEISCLLSLIDDYPNIIIVLPLELQDGNTTLLIVLTFVLADIAIENVVAALIKLE